MMCLFIHDWKWGAAVWGNGYRYQEATCTRCGKVKARDISI